MQGNRLQQALRGGRYIFCVEVEARRLRWLAERILRCHRGVAALFIFFTAAAGAGIVTADFFHEGLAAMTHGKLRGSRAN